MIPDMSRPPPNFNAPPPNLPTQDLITQPNINIITGEYARAFAGRDPIDCNLSAFCDSANRPMGQFDESAGANQTPTPIPEETKPTVPYYELPAGLMVPLIRLEDCSYHPLDPEDIRLPAAAPPSERLLQAIEAFYSMPSHDRPRDG